MVTDFGIGDSIFVKKIVLKKKHKKLIAAMTALLIVIMAAGYTVFIAPNLEKEEWVYKEIQVEKGELTVGVTESGTLEFVPTSLNYDLELKTNDDFEKALGKYIYIKTYEKLESAGNQKEMYGYLDSYDDESIKVNVIIKTRTNLITIEKTKIAKVRLAVKF